MNEKKNYYFDLNIKFFLKNHKQLFSYNFDDIWIKFKKIISKKEKKNFDVIGCGFRDNFIFDEKSFFKKNQFI